MTIDVQGGWHWHGRRGLIVKLAAWLYRRCDVMVIRFHRETGHGQLEIAAHDDVDLDRFFSAGISVLHQAQHDYRNKKGSA